MSFNLSQLGATAQATFLIEFLSGLFTVVMDDGMPKEPHDDTPADGGTSQEGSASSRDVLARRLAEATRSFSQPDERLRAEEAELFRCLDQGLLTAEVPATLPDFIGSEHEVWSDGQQVIKATLPGSFGRRWGQRRFAFYRHRLGDFWYRGMDNLLAFDVEPGNLVRTQFGIVPIDVILQNPDQGFPGFAGDS